MDHILESLEKFASGYSPKGYKQDFDYDQQSGNYRLVLKKEDRSITIRDGYDGNGLSAERRMLTSFDVLFVLEGKTFLKYISDYPLDEYQEQLSKAFKLIEAFFDGKYTITPERYMIFWKKNYLNIKFNGGEEHLLQTK